MVRYALMHEAAICNVYRALVVKLLVDIFPIFSEINYLRMYPTSPRCITAKLFRQAVNAWGRGGIEESLCPPLVPGSVDT